VRVHEKKIEERSYLKEIVCDFCEAKAPFGSWRGDGYYSVPDVEIHLREGEQYPEGGSGTQLDIDACPTCFREKILPFLKSIAVREFKETEWDT